MQCFRCLTCRRRLSKMSPSPVLTHTRCTYLWYIRIRGLELSQTLRSEVNHARRTTKRYPCNPLSRSVVISPLEMGLVCFSSEVYCMPATPRTRGESDGNAAALFIGADSAPEAGASFLKNANRMLREPTLVVHLRRHEKPEHVHCQSAIACRNRRHEAPSSPRVA